MKTIKLLISLAVVFLAGFIGQIYTMPSIPTWYATLNKPFFNPPNWIFGPVWTSLYVLMAVAAWLVWQKDWSRAVKIALGFFIGQLALNSLWSIIFFGLHLPLWAFIEIIVLWLAILLTIFKFKALSQPAAWLLVPYILWVSFAAVLNLMIVVLN
ncbi:TspO/MBR family protein [Candidatus Margulisiibacteriota bacterium]